MKKFAILSLALVFILACSTTSAPTATPIPPTNTATATAIPPTSSMTPVPPTPEPSNLIVISPGKFGHTLWVDVVAGDYRLVGGTTLRTGSSIGLEEENMTFPKGLAINVEGGEVTLKGTSHAPGTKLIVDASGNLIPRE